MPQVIQTFDSVESIRYKIRSSDGSQIIKIFENNPQNIIRKMGIIAEHTTISSFIKDLTCYTEIESIPEVGFIDFELEDSVTDKAVKALEHTWTKPSIHLKLWDNLDNRGWEPLCIVPLQHPEIYAYRKYDLLDELTRNLAVEAGDNWAIGVSIEDAGWGGVKANDIVIIRGNATRQVVVNNPIAEVTKEIILNTNGSVTDENIGQRAIDDTRFLGNASTGNLTILLSSLAHQINKIVGKDNWKQLPATTLEKLKHLENLTDIDVVEVKGIGAIKLLYESIEDDLAVLEANVLKLNDIDTIFNTQWQNLVLTSNWVDCIEFGTYPPQWRLLKTGEIQLRGAIKALTTPAYEQIIATLPVAARPEKTVYIQSFGSSVYQVSINTSGNLRYQLGTATAGFLIDKSYSIH